MKPRTTDPIIDALRDQKRLYDAFVSTIDTDNGAAASKAYHAAFNKLLRTKPKTRAGAAALIRHCLAEDGRFTDGDDPVTLLHTLAKAMPALRD